MYQPFSMPRHIFVIGFLVFFSTLQPFAASEEATASELERIQALFDSKDPITWVLTGDSITHGALHTDGWRSYPEHFAERVRWEMGRVRDVVINTGISGDTVPGLLSDLEHRVTRFEPTVVSVMMGMNDAAKGEAGREGFKKSYLELIDRLRAETDALILLHTPNPITAVAASRSDLPAYAEIIREVAAERGVALVDQEKLWNEYVAQPRKDLNYLLSDGTIHPDNYGHILMAHNLFKVLDIFDPNANTCRLYIP
jgi:lysophospholipase L1-like esterase